MAVSILTPLAILLVWCLWEWCYDTHDTELDDNEEEEESRYHSLSFQLATGCVACLCVCAIVSTVAITVLLLVGNERIDAAVTADGDLVETTLPLVRKLCKLIKDCNGPWC